MYNEHLTANRAIATKKLATLTIQLRVEAFFAWHKQDARVFVEAWKIEYIGRAHENRNRRPKVAGWKVALRFFSFW